MLRDAQNRFPQGALEQERDALRVEALGCAGRATEAADEAAAFRRAYPSSPHTPAVGAFLDGQGSP
jgi:hypothetical protein